MVMGGEAWRSSIQYFVRRLFTPGGEQKSISRGRLFFRLVYRALNSCGDPLDPRDPLRASRLPCCPSQLEAMRRLPDAQNQYPFIFEGHPGFVPFRDTLASLVMPHLQQSGSGTV